MMKEFMILTKKNEFSRRDFAKKKSIFHVFKVNYVLKLWSEMNQTRLEVGHFKTVSGHFFDNYINSLHKTEDLTVILRCLTLKNLN